jgi:hypothetical protein
MESESSSFLRRTGRNAFMACAGLLLGPSLLAWSVRGVAAAAQCAPGADPCRGVALGGMFRDALALAWAVGINTWLLLGIGVAAAIAAMFMRRPILGAGAMLFGPLLALILPMAAMYSAAHPGCEVNEAGSACVLWGAQIGEAMHAAASVPGEIYGFAPLSFALALMLGVLGWFVARKRTKGHAHASMHNAASGTSFRVPDYRFTDRDQS